MFLVALKETQLVEYCIFEEEEGGCCIDMKADGKQRQRTPTQTQVGDRPKTNKTAGLGKDSVTGRLQSGARGAFGEVMWSPGSWSFGMGAHRNWTNGLYNRVGRPSSTPLQPPLNLPLSLPHLTKLRLTNNIWSSGHLSGKRNNTV